MIERLADMPAGTLGFRASRKLTRDEYHEQLMKPIYEVLDRGAKINLLFEIADDFDGLELGALWEDVKAAGSVGLKHRSSWGRMALVTDKDWIRHGVSAFGWLSPGELKLFEPDQLEAARAWVAESPAP
jgi:SpoIIAA-like